MLAVLQSNSESRGQRLHADSARFVHQPLVARAEWRTASTPVLAGRQMRILIDRGFVAGPDRDPRPRLVGSAQIQAGDAELELLQR